ncbi:response regulator transcription factor, partial [Klebsiella pneumoniae]|nr:response regulator transcription factor [Klebsiella pneumoniae]
ILTSFTDEEAMLDAILAEARGNVEKDISTIELIDAIRAVGTGKSLLDNRAAAALMRKLRDQAEAKTGPLASLTEQER